MSVNSHTESESAVNDIVDELKERNIACNCQSVPAFQETGLSEVHVPDFLLFWFVVSPDRTVCARVPVQCEKVMADTRALHSCARICDLDRVCVHTDLRI